MPANCVCGKVRRLADVCIAWWSKAKNFGVSHQMFNEMSKEMFDSNKKN
jgi:hypothetical protein